MEVFVLVSSGGITMNQTPSSLIKSRPISIAAKYLYRSGSEPGVRSCDHLDSVPRLPSRPALGCHRK
jgi:hypothetical protein